MKSMNIAIGKIGKSVKFKSVHIETGGDACMILYSSIARMNPEFNFYFIGPNWLDKLNEKEYNYIFPNHNVFSAYRTDKDSDEPFLPTINYLKENNINIDFALVMSGMCSEVNVPNFVKGKNGNYPKILNAFKNYVGPYIYTLNKLNCPLYLISEDARYITVNARDLYNRERVVFTQIDGNFQPIKHIKSETDHSLVTEDIKAIYAGVERIFMMAIDPKWKENIDINRKLNSEGEHLIIISNGCGQKDINRANGNKSSRLKVYKEWVLDGTIGTPYEGSKIYGVWDDATYDAYPRIQNKMLVDLSDEVADAKYSLVYSIMPGFVSVKAWEMIIRGLIPFIHPDYDKHRLLNLPSYCYVSSVDEFINKMKELDSDQDKYISLLNECFDCVKEEDLSGKRLNNFIFNYIANDLGFEYTEKDGCDPIFNHFAKDVFDNTQLENNKTKE